MRVNMVIATFNRLFYTKVCIPNIIETASSTIPYMLTVIDNGSTDGTPDYLKELFEAKKIHNLLLLKENIGVSKAHNIGWKLFNDIDIYGKIDNDVLFLKNNWLDDIVNVLDNAPELGVLGYNVEDKNIYSVTNNGKVSYRRKYGNIGGCCYFVPKHVHEKIGFWCENYDLYGEEDADYSARINHLNLINAYMEDETVMTHEPNIVDKKVDPNYANFKIAQRKDNLSGNWNSNLKLYNQGNQIYQDSNILELYKDQIQTNL